jgi:hypothetical protein
MNDIFYFLFAGAGFIALLTFLFNFMSNGFFLAWFKGKSSRGKKIMAIMKTKLGFYPAFGTIQGDSYVFTDHETKRDNNNKIPKRLKIPSIESPFFRLFNIWVCMIDESNGTFVNIRGSPGGTSGFDPIFQESLIMRALIRPTFEQKKTLFFIVIIIGILILLILAVVILVKVSALPGLIRPVSQTVGQVAGNVINGTVV